MLTEGQLYMSTSCQPDSRVIQAFSDVEKPSLFSDLAVKAAKSENKKAFQCQRRLRLERVSVLLTWPPEEKPL